MPETNASEPRIHIFGASGSGTTTLGRALAARLGVAFLDSDDFFWEKTELPFQRPKLKDARAAELAEAIGKTGSWVLSGSLMGWGDFLIPAFDLAIYLHLERGLRLERLMARELERYGDRIAPGGDMRATHEEFMAWAGRYDKAGTEQRSAVSHAEWAKSLACPILRIDSESSVEANAEHAMEAMRSAAKSRGASSQSGSSVVRDETFTPST